MIRRIFLPFLLLLSIVLCACTVETPPPVTPTPPPDTTTQEQQSQSPAPDSGTTVPEDTQKPEDGPSPFIPATLTVELVVEWEKADTLLSRLEDMSDLLYTALEEVGYPMDRVTLTISTAGGFTAESLAQGGIDAAVLPTVDFLTCRASTAGIAMSCEEVSETVIALSLAKGQPDSTFCTALFDALTKTESGSEFLALCRPGAVFAVPTEETIQAVIDWVAQQEKDGGHA